MDKQNGEDRHTEKELLELAYKQSCDLVRHYSNATRSIRTIAVVQGLAILYAVFFVLSRTEKPWVAVLVALTGILITLILKVLHENYLANFKDQETVAVSLEDQIFRCSEITKPFKQQREQREERWRTEPFSRMKNDWDWKVYYGLLQLVLPRPPKEHLEANRETTGAGRTEPEGTTNNADNREPYFGYLVNKAIYVAFLRIFFGLNIFIGLYSFVFWYSTSF